MLSQNPDKAKTSHKHHSTSAEGIALTLEWLITAFILAFTFRAFVLEAFRIPTGSMADTLKGDHFQIRCTQCGYAYDHNFDLATRYGRTKDGRYNLSYSPQCPSCEFSEKPPMAMPKANGDRILVYKCLYHFTDPKRWDVVVFKNPTDPRENYIKRLIAKPGETLQIIDGDVYIDGKIARKPPKVQAEMWMPIYNNDYRPARPKEARFGGAMWRQPFGNLAGTDSKWTSESPVTFNLDSDPEQINTLFYDTKRGNDFKASYAYGRPQYNRDLPYCSDLMMNFYATIDKPKGTVGIGLSKYETTYKASVDLQGNMTITASTAGGRAVELTAKHISPPAVGRPVLVKFANVDHTLVFEVGKEKLTHNLGQTVDAAGTLKPAIQPKASIFGAGKLSLSHIEIYRDIHYLTATKFGQPSILRATGEDPFELGDDEFFVMGDNSPDSLDSRWWPAAGFGNAGKEYSAGTVPRDYLIGKAFFVYWPSAFKIFPAARSFLLRNVVVVPDVGRMRFIHGGVGAGE